MSGNVGGLTFGGGMGNIVGGGVIGMFDIFVINFLVVLGMLGSIFGFGGGGGGGGSGIGGFSLLYYSDGGISGR